MLQALTNPTQSKMSNKFQAILASIFIGHISAMGCSPAYYPGGASYTVGTSVSQSVAILNPLVWTSCTIGGIDCLTGWKKTGGVATTVTHNYVCNSLQWCNNVGYAPGGVYSDLAWTKEAVACSVSTTAHLQLEYYCYIQKNLTSRLTDLNFNCHDSRFVIIGTTTREHKHLLLQLQSLEVLLVLYHLCLDVPPLGYQVQPTLQAQWYQPVEKASSAMHTP